MMKQAQRIVDSLEVNESKLTPPPDEYGCPDCDGYGNLIDGDGTRECKCKLAYFRKVAIKKLPSEYQQMTLDNFDTDTSRKKQLRDFALAYIKSVKKSREVLQGVCSNLYIYGLKGTGKTHVLVGVYRELLKLNIFSVFLPYTTLIEGMRENVNDPDYFDPRWNEPMYFLDGVGELRATPTEFEVEVVRRLITQRHRSELPTCITTNLTPSQLGRAYGDFVASRLEQGFVKDTEGIKDARQKKGVHIR